MNKSKSNPFFQFLLSLIVGTLLILSGILKIIYLNDVLFELKRFKFPELLYAAPYISVFEIYIGARLFFMYRMRNSGLMSFVLFNILTLFYLYGYYTFGVEDCMCFGRVKFLNTEFLHIIIRNGILILISLYIWLTGINEKMWYTWKKTMLALALVVPAVIISLLMNFSPEEETAIETLNTETKVKPKLLGENMNETFLGLMCPTSVDSTYLVFLYSADCRHCVSSIESINLLNTRGIFDAVIGITDNSGADSLLKEIAYPEFEVKKFPKTSIQKVATRLPVTFIVVNDTIRLEKYGAITSAYYFQKQYLK